MENSNWAEYFFTFINDRPCEEENDFANLEWKRPPRKIPSKDERYMGLAWMIAGFSKDPDTQIGAIFIGKGNYPLSFGYNGLPRGIDDDSFDWQRETKRNVVVHAEMNAIRHSDKKKLTGSTLYVTAMPCHNCMIQLINYGVKRIVYYNLKVDKNSSINDNAKDKTLYLAKLSGIAIEEFQGGLGWLGERIKQI
jgi:dCMP deaminase